MPGYRLTAWLRPLLTLAALAGVLSLAACGGGNGAPNKPSTAAAHPARDHARRRRRRIRAIHSPSWSPAARAVRDLPATKRRCRSSARWTATRWSSCPEVSAPTPRYADGPRRVGTDGVRRVTVRPALLLPASITITGNPNCGASGADLCSGQDGTASVQVTGPAGAPLAGRTVRFDVVQGTFSISSTVPGQPLVQSLTVTTDQNGNATVRLVVPVNARDADRDDPRNRRHGRQQRRRPVHDRAVHQRQLGAVGDPDGRDDVHRARHEHCSDGASATFYVFGGTPPYTVADQLPDVRSASPARRCNAAAAASRSRQRAPASRGLRSRSPTQRGARC